MFTPMFTPMAACPRRLVCRVEMDEMPEIGQTMNVTV